jgi:hypothetical protein
LLYNSHIREVTTDQYLTNASNTEDESTRV